MPSPGEGCKAQVLDYIVSRLGVNCWAVLLCRSRASLPARLSSGPPAPASPSSTCKAARRCCRSWAPALFIYLFILSFFLAPSSLSDLRKRKMTHIHTHTHTHTHKKVFIGCYGWELCPRADFSIARSRLCRTPLSRLWSTWKSCEWPPPLFFLSLSLSLLRE